MVIGVLRGYWLMVYLAERLEAHYRKCYSSCKVVRDEDTVTYLIYDNTWFTKYWVIQGPLQRRGLLQGNRDIDRRPDQELPTGDAAEVVKMKFFVRVSFRRFRTVVFSDLSKMLRLSGGKVKLKREKSVVNGLVFSKLNIFSA